MSVPPRTRNVGQSDENKRVRPDYENREELSMPAAAMKEKNHVENPAATPDKEEFVPDWMRYLIRSLREAEERKKKRSE